MNQPEPWEHVSGYRLNADGKAMRYEHPETGYEGYIEATLNEYDYEGESVMEYLSVIYHSSGYLIEHSITDDKDGALETLREMMEEYS